MLCLKKFPLCREDGEAIEVLLLPRAHILQFAADDSLPKSSGMLLALMYLLHSTSS